MAYPAPANRVTVKPFATMPPLPKRGLLGFTRPSDSEPDTTTQAVVVHAVKHTIDREEPCFVTGIVKLTNEQAHLVNAVREGGERKERVEEILIGHRIVSEGFTIDSPQNIIMLQLDVHRSLDMYASIAITCSERTLEKMIKLIEGDNDMRQKRALSGGSDLGRNWEIMEEARLDVEYQLIVLHPRYFLPEGSGDIFVRYDEKNKKHVPYHIYNGILHDDLDQEFPVFPAPQRMGSDAINPFLAILNAEIKFSRYPKQKTGEEELPGNIKRIMEMTIHLVNLLYWEPASGVGTTVTQAECQNNVHKWSLSDTSDLTPLSDMDPNEPNESKPNNSNRIEDDEPQPKRRRF